MSQYKEVVYYKEERSFGSYIPPYVLADEPHRFYVTVFPRRESKRALFTGLASVFATSNSNKNLEAIIRTPELQVVSWVQALEDIPSRVRARPDTGFMHDANTLTEFTSMRLSTIVRSLITQAFEGLLMPQGKTKLIGHIAKRNEASLRARFFMQDPATLEFYYTTITGETRDHHGREMHILTTDLTQRANLATQVLHFEEQTGYAFNRGGHNG